jgi:hypothetical protein
MKKSTLWSLIAVVVLAVILSWLFLYTNFLTDSQITTFTSTHAMLITFISVFVYPALAALAAKLLAVMDKNTPTNNALDFVRNSIQFGRAPTQVDTIDARGADPGVEQRINVAMVQAKEQAKAEIFSSMQRGGAFAYASGRRNDDPKSPDSC